MSVFVMLFLVFLAQFFPIVPVVAAAVSSSNQTIQLQNTFQSPSVSSSLQISTQSDFSTIDWDASITLPKDIEEAQKNVQQKLNEKKYAEAKAITPIQKNILDTQTLEYFSVPKKIQETVNSFTQNGKVPPAQKQILQKKLQDMAVEDQKYFTSSTSTTSSSEQFIIMDKKLLFKPKRVIPIHKEVQVSPLQITKTVSRVSLSPEKIKNILQKEDTLSSVLPVAPTPKVSLNFWNTVKDFFFPSVQAVDVIPLFAADPNTLDNLTALQKSLLFISNSQNADQSFGTTTSKFVTTYDVLQLAGFLGLTQNTQVDGALTFLRTATSSNSLDEAVRAKVSYISGSRDAWTNFMQKKNRDGGFGIESSYQSDFFTTLEVLKSLSDLSAEYNIQNDLAGPLNFLLSKVDGSGEVVLTPNANPSYFATNRLLRLLKPLQNIQFQNAQGSTILVQDKINAMINFLASEYVPQKQTLRWSNDAIDVAMTLSNFTLYNVHSELRPSLQKVLLQKQLPNGSFENNFIATVEAARALAAPDVFVTQVTPTTPMQTGEPAGFAVTIENRGYRPTNVINLHLFFGSLFVGTYEHLESQGVRLLPGEVATLRINKPDTSNISGQLRINMYVEVQDDDNAVNNWQEITVNFVPRANGQPALPLFYIAQNYPGYRFPGINVRWVGPLDPLTRGYLVMYRQRGRAEWNYYPLNISYTGGFFTSPEFLEGESYEVTVGVLGPQDTVTYFADTTVIAVTSNSNLNRGDIFGTLTDNSTPLPNATLFTYGLPPQTTTSTGEYVFRSFQNGLTAVTVTSSPQYEQFFTLVHVLFDQEIHNARIFTKLKSDTVAPVVTHLGVGPENIPRSNNPLHIYARGDDNVAVAGANFFLYSPLDQTWEYLGGGKPNPGQNMVDFTFFLKETNVGAGFKLKVIFFDFQGNVSVPFETLPFEILSGTPPQLTLTSPNGNEIWQLGTTSTIRWTTSAGNQVPTVSIDAIYGGQSENIASNIPNTGTYNWAIPRTTYFAGQNIKLKITGEDTRLHLTGQDQSDAPLSIVNSSTLPQVPWGEKQSITVRGVENPPNTMFSASKAVYTADGTAHVVYRSVIDILGSPRTITEQLLYTRKTTSTPWTDPVVIYTNQTQTDLNLTGYSWIEEFSLQGIAQNKLALVYNTANANGCIGQNQKEVFLLEANERGEWSLPQNISTNATASSAPRISVDATGKIFVMWTDGATYTALCVEQGNKTLQYKTRGNNVWTAIENLVQVRAPAFTTLAVTTSGTPYIVYKDMSDLTTKYTSKQNNLWAAAQVLTQNSFEGSLTSGKNNTLHYVTKQNYQDPVQNRLRARITYFSWSGAWQPLQEVLTTSTLSNYENPTVTVDRDNRPHILAEAVNSQNQRQLIWSMKNANAFLAPQKIHQDSEAIVPQTARLFSNADQSMSVVFQSMFALREHVFISTGNFVNFPPAPVSPPQPPPVVPTSTPNLLVDGTMESPTNTLWSSLSLVGTYRKTTTTFFSGSQSMSLDASSGGFQQRFIPVATGTTYTVSFRYKVLTGTLLPGFAMNNSEIDPFGGGVRLTTTGTWQFYSRNFIVPLTYSSNFRLRFIAQNFRGYIDDVIITRAAQQLPAPPVPPYINDGTMEATSTLAWVNFETVSSTKVVSTTHSGLQSMRLVNPPNIAGGIYQLMTPLEPSRQYRLQFWYRIDRGTFSPTLRIINANSDYQGINQVFQPTNGQWRLYSRTFVTPANINNNLRMYFRGYNSNLYVDDVTITPM